MKNGIVFYEGPSAIDGRPVIAAASGLITPSTNVKTGPMVQIWFLLKNVPPMQAVHTGEDVSICGNCIHRGRVVEHPVTGARRNVDRTCYVTLFHGPRQVWQGIRDEKYDYVPLEIARRILTRRQVRLGAYGDPASIPIGVLETVLEKAGAVTGYTHQWRIRPDLAVWCMASCETEEERLEAKALGFRVFRVRSKDGPVLSGEGICPASTEMEKATRCSECLLCGGNRGRGSGDVVIRVHGTGAARFEANRALAFA